MSGWIKLHRSMLSWEWYTEPNCFVLFMHLLMTVNYEKKRWRGIEILPGQIITSLPKLAEQSRLTVQNVRTVLTKLKSTGEITDISTNEYRLITVCNWSKYQGDETGQSTGDQQAANRPSTATKEVKNLRSKEQITKPYSVSESVWCDFLELRKKKKAPVTQTVIDGIEKEAVKAKITLNAALSECCIRGWQSFKADWFNKPSQFEKPKQTKAGAINIARKSHEQ